MSDPVSLPTTANAEEPAPPDQAAPASAAPDPDEERFRAASQLLLTDEGGLPAWAGLGCLAVSLGLFLLSLLTLGWGEMVLFVGVLFFHEAGHWLGMRLFRYRNVQMFFIPFFGAAVAGRKHAAPAWQQAVILLLGPLPGVFLGLILLLWLAPPAGDWRLRLVFCLVFLNATNLAPLVPLDGGRFLDVMLFARRPYQAVCFRLFAVAGLGLGAWLVGLNVFGVMLGLVALGTLLFTPARYRRARLERAFGRNHHGCPEALDQLSEQQRRDLFGWARLLSPDEGDPAALANRMRELHEHAVTRRPGWPAWLGLGSLYLAGVAAALAVVPIHERQKRKEAEKGVDRLIAIYDRASAESAELTRRALAEGEAQRVRRAVAGRAASGGAGVARGRPAPARRGAEAAEGAGAERQAPRPPVDLVRDVPDGDAPPEREAGGGVRATGCATAVSAVFGRNHRCPCNLYSRLTQPWHNRRVTRVRTTPDFLGQPSCARSVLVQRTADFNCLSQARAAMRWGVTLLVCFVVARPTLTEARAPAPLPKPERRIERLPETNAQEAGTLLAQAFPNDAEAIRNSPYKFVLHHADSDVDVAQSYAFACKDVIFSTGGTVKLVQARHASHRRSKGGQTAHLAFCAQPCDAVIVFDPPVRRLSEVPKGKIKCIEINDTWVLGSLR
jgi:Zn-dependent protease